jgi:glucokinase
MKDTARFLGAGVASIINVLNPEMVVIAGGVTRAGEHLFEPLRAEVRRRAFRSAQECCRIVSGQLPGTAGVVGAAAVFKKENYGNVSPCSRTPCCRRRSWFPGTTCCCPCRRSERRWSG